MAQRAIAAVAAVAMGLGIASSAAAYDLWYQWDYTVPPDGLTHVWDFKVQSPDPNATITVQAPNEVFGVAYYGDGTQTYFGFLYRFDEVVRPLETLITVWAPADYNVCTPSSPPDRICGRVNAVWGNATFIHVHSDTDWAMGGFAGSAVVPEPTTWAMMILGCGLVGGALRRRRADLVA